MITLKSRTLGAEAESTLTSRLFLAVLLSRLEQYEEAEKEYLQALPLCDRTFGADHPETLRLCHNLAQCLTEQDKIPEALTYARRAHAGYLKTLGKDAPATQASGNLVKHLTALETKV